MKRAVFYLMLVYCFSCQEKKPMTEEELYRPDIHFTPPKAWMNDPNGMVYHKGVYHLFYQHNPDSSVWGPMHWGHATSTDLIEWQHEPIALFPDSLGTIFSGSAVIDSNNTAGFAKPGETALVAIFTHHNTQGEKAGRSDFQTQSLAYSIDDGKTWIKYDQNPVIKNPGIKDFRDPKVIWYAPKQKWIMSLAAQNKILFYSSKDLKNWIAESSFGEDVGAHGGVWECPDLFPMQYEGKTIWALIVNLNPGAPNKGSGTQYFLGEFDGKSFKSFTDQTLWLDYGPDNYAGVTWSNTGDQKILIGWMSNWMYANQVPTQSWRSAMTIPRELKLMKLGETWRLASLPVSSLQALGKEAFHKVKVDAIEKIRLSGSSVISFQADATKNFTVTCLNDQQEKVVIGYDPIKQEFYIDRRSSGQTAFHPEFAAIHTAPRLSNNPLIQVKLVLDKTSVELFADDGLSVMTSIFFPKKGYQECWVDPQNGQIMGLLLEQIGK
ncbi:glycoside hydrolase family 32 protein [Sediminibacterium sp.]|uniref:glycoside hydrolase family 32 protein n=1 Tax=Sediminibacterium sp. TaxID=1917865 RepID=UPI003F728001